MNILIMQAMSFVPTIRDFFLREENYKNVKMPPGDISLILGTITFIRSHAVTCLLPTLEC